MQHKELCCYCDNFVKSVCVAPVCWLAVTVSYISTMCVVVTDLCSCSLDHFQLALVDLDAPEESIEKLEEHPPCQPEQKKRRGAEKKN